MTKIEKMFKGLSQEEIAELNSLMSGTRLDIENGLFTTFQLTKTTVSVASREGQDMLEKEGYSLKFGMVANGEDEDGFVVFTAMMIATKGEEKIKFPGVRKAEVTPIHVSAGKGRMGLNEIKEVWAMNDLNMSIAEIAEKLGRKQETIFSLLAKDRPVTI